MQGTCKGTFLQRDTEVGETVGCPLDRRGTVQNLTVFVYVDYTVGFVDARLYCLTYRAAP